MALVVKNPPANAGDVIDMGSIPGTGRSPGGGHGNQLQYFCLENPTDREIWQAMVHSMQRIGRNWSNLARKYYNELFKQKNLGVILNSACLTSNQLPSHIVYLKNTSQMYSILFPLPHLSSSHHFHLPRQLRVPLKWSPCFHFCHHQSLHSIAGMSYHRLFYRCFSSCAPLR